MGEQWVVVGMCDEMSDRSGKGKNCRAALSNLAKYLKGLPSRAALLSAVPAMFSKADIGKTVEITGDKLKVGSTDGGSFYPAVRWGGAAHTDCRGTIKCVEEGLYGRVQLKGGSEFENPAPVRSAPARRQSPRERTAGRARR